MSGSKESRVTSRAGDDQTNFWDELCRSRMEVQWLKWEKERLSAELEATRKMSLPKSADEVYPKRRDIPQRKVDSEVYFKLPEDNRCQVLACRLNWFRRRRGMWRVHLNRGLSQCQLNVLLVRIRL